jgi:hypothetical protein
VVKKTILFTNIGLDLEEGEAAQGETKTGRREESQAGATGGTVHASHSSLVHLPANSKSGLIQKNP